MKLKAVVTVLRQREDGSWEVLEKSRKNYVNHLLSKNIIGCLLNLNKRVVQHSNKKFDPSQQMWVVKGVRAQVLTIQIHKFFNTKIGT